MRDDQRLRTAIRLRIQGGLVRLRHPALAPLECALVDLSRGGCCCRVPLAAQPSQTAAVWSGILRSGCAVQLDLTVEPFLKDLPLEGEIRLVSEHTGGDREIGVRFGGVDAHTVQVLDEVILEIAAGKVRRAFSPQAPAPPPKPTRVGVQAPRPEGITPPLGTARAAVIAPPEPESPPQAPEPPQTAPASAEKAVEEEAEPVDVGEEPEPVADDEPGAPAATTGDVDEESLAKLALHHQPTPARALPPVRAPAPEPARAEGQADSGERDPADEDAGHRSTQHMVRPPGLALAASQRVAPPLTPAAPAPAPAASAMAHETPSPDRRHSRYAGRRLGDVLVELGKLPRPQVEDAVERATRAGVRLGRFLVREGLLTSEDVCRALALKFGLPMTDLSEVSSLPDLGRLFPVEVMTRYEFVPIDSSDRIVCVAAADPLPETLVAELERACGKRVETFLAPEELLLQALDRMRPSERREDRRYARYRAEWPVAFQLCNRLGRITDPTLYEGRTVDVSEGGVQMECAAPKDLTPDDMRRRGLCLRIKVSSPGEPIQAVAEPRFIQIQENQPLPWVLGLRFAELSAHDRRRLRELCLTLGRQQK